MSAVLCEVPFLGAGQCFYIFLYQRFIMTCFRLYVLFRQPLDHYLKLVKVPSQTAVFPIGEMRTLPSQIFWVIPFPSALRVFLPFSAQFVKCSFLFFTSFKVITNKWNIVLLKSHEQRGIFIGRQFWQAGIVVHPPDLLITSDGFCDTSGYGLSVLLSPCDVCFFLSAQNFLVIWGRLGLYRSWGRVFGAGGWSIAGGLYCICIVYKTFYGVFIHFYWKDMPTAFSPLGGLMCPHNKKSLWLPISCTCSPPTPDLQHV